MGGVKFPGKKRYVTLEWPLSSNKRNNQSEIAWEYSECGCHYYIYNSFEATHDSTNTIYEEPFLSLCPLKKKQLNGHTLTPPGNH